MAITTLALLAPLIALPLVGADNGAQIFKKRDTCAKSVESCSTAASAATSCCVNKPGGQMLQTQFWDTDPGKQLHNLRQGTDATTQITET